MALVGFKHLLQSIVFLSDSMVRFFCTVYQVLSLFKQKSFLPADSSSGFFEEVAFSEFCWSGHAGRCQEPHL